MAFTTTTRIWMNRGLGVIGLKINTTRADRTEALRLRALTARGHWSGPRFAAGLQLDEKKYLRFLREICLPYREQYDRWPRTQPELANGFYLNNEWFGAVDAEVLYSILRWYRPRVVVEVGSGFSTRLIRRAIADAGLPTHLCSIDPTPRVEIREYVDEQLQNPVEELDPCELARRLDVNDVLFIDSSHMVTNGGDVPFLFLEVVPRLVPGVLIHVHDIFLPFEYPQEWMIYQRCGWNEQYLVHALLCDNSRLEVLWPAYYMWRHRRADVRAVIPGSADALPSSLWLVTR